MIRKVKALNELIDILNDCRQHFDWYNQAACCGISPGQRHTKGCLPSKGIKIIQGILNPNPRRKPRKK